MVSLVMPHTKHHDVTSLSPVCGVSVC